MSTTPSPQWTPPPPSKRRMKDTLFTRHRSTVEPMTITKDWKAIHIMAVNLVVTSLRRNVVLDDRPPLINISEKELTRKERTTLAQLRSGHCSLLSSYKSRSSKDASLDDNDTVGLMEQTSGRNTGTRLS